MRRKILGIALILLAGLCLCLSLNQADKYRQAEKTYDDILEKYTKEKKVSKKKQDFVVDWKKLWKTNKDVVGWIKMDSGADYPILHGDSNEEYLHTDLYGDYNINGSIFVNADNSRDWSDPNTIIYGHRMNNGSMFGSNKNIWKRIISKSILIFPSTVLMDVMFIKYLTSWLLKTEHIHIHINFLIKRAILNISLK